MSWQLIRKGKGDGKGGRPKPKNKRTLINSVTRQIATKKTAQDKKLCYNLHRLARRETNKLATLETKLLTNEDQCGKLQTKGTINHDN